jgi:hypothetical protein
VFSCAQGVIAGVPNMDLRQFGVFCRGSEITMVVTVDRFSVKCQRFFQVVDSVEVELVRGLRVDDLASN